MKIVKKLIAIMVLALAPMLNGDLLNQFTHVQQIDYVQQNVPQEISVGMNSELTLKFTESDFTYMSFSIPEANLTLIADIISWKFGTDEEGKAIFRITGGFQEDYFQERQFLEASYTFYSLEGSSLSMPLNHALLQPKAQYTFSFDGQDSQGSVSRVADTSDPGVPPVEIEILDIDLVLTGWIFLSGRFFYSTDWEGWFYIYDENNVYDCQREVWYSR